MDYKFIAIGLMSLGLVGAAIGLGWMFSALFNGIARNPESEDKLKKYVFVGAAFIEAIGLFAFVLSLIILFN
ncbi:MAG: ATP synthase F0, C subunit [Candidatus Xenolissoclinum pacificiensis L6]|uniref:ATP synthase subunit c n=1 Tax=Candidatus Xenolissoclinum pacificiensis L6 TaxID=1401685 RepID=W2V170_9RICK|nr:MAG: ATP synthase F0, C subunit [Candidatus Xenolissoclinum pacificiensis L6]